VHFLKYCATHPYATLCYRASDLILHIHSDAACVNETKARSHVGGHHFLGDRASPINQPNNPAILNIAKILKHAVSSTAEAEVWATFLNGKEAVVVRTTLAEMGHLQPATPMQVNNSTANGILNGNVKQQRSHAMDVHFYWMKDRTQQGQFHVFWAPGCNNLADYFTKHHLPAHHHLMRPLYLPEPKSIHSRIQR
jgi:hypothetical protein